METTNALKANGTTREGKTRQKSEQHRPDKWAMGRCLDARGTQRTGGRAMSRARTPSMQGGRCTTASHQSRSHSVTVPRDGASPRSAVRSKIGHASRPLTFLDHHATARHHPARSRRPARRGATSSLRVPDTRSPTNWGPCGPHLGLRTQVTVRNELEPWVRSRKKPAKPDNLPRAGLRYGGLPGPDYARALATLSEVVKTARA